jgi:sec-independent protein translocase protein TatC
MQKFTLREHFLELKSRLIKVLSFFIIAFFISYYYSDNIYQFLLEPLVVLSHDGIRKVIYTGLTEAFVTYLKLGAFTAFLLTIPVICWQIYFFIAPGLHTREKKIISFVLVLSPLLFFTGAFFVFYLVMPKAWHFFLSFENKNALLPLVLEARVSEYLSLVMQLIIAFGVAFQMPVIMVICAVLGIITSEALRKRRRIAIVINFIIAAIFTPPDVLSQIGLAIPLLLLYEVSIILCKFVENKR